MFKSLPGCSFQFKQKSQNLPPKSQKNGLLLSQNMIRKKSEFLTFLSESNIECSVCKHNYNRQWGDNESNNISVAKSLSFWKCTIKLRYLNCEIWML